MPGVTFPTVGPLGLSSPPSRSGTHPAIGTMFRYDCQSPISRRFAFRSRAWIPCVRSLFFARWQVERYPPRRGICSPGSPCCRRLRKEATGPPKFPSYPCRHMPPSKTPVVSRTLVLAHTRLLPSASTTTSAFTRALARAIPFGPRRFTFRGSVTRPAPSLHPASYPPLLGRTRVHYWPADSALARRDPESVRTLWVTLTNFMGLRPILRTRTSLARRSR